MFVSRVSRWQSLLIAFSPARSEKSISLRISRTSNQVLPLIASVTSIDVASDKGSLMNFNAFTLAYPSYRWHIASRVSFERPLCSQNRFTRVVLSYGGGGVEKHSGLRTFVRQSKNDRTFAPPTPSTNSSFSPFSFFYFFLYLKRRICDRHDNHRGTDNRGKLPVAERSEFPGERARSK